MNNNILGIHHITAIAGDAKQNLDFYTKILGQRLVKKTVNFDDPGTYHFYFGDENGTPGTILTFFPWARVRAGRIGAGMATDIGYSIPVGSAEFWQHRFAQYDVKVIATGDRFGEPFITFEDPDKLTLTLIENDDPRRPWETNGITTAAAIRGFHSTTLTLNKTERTANILTELFGYRHAGTDGNRLRYATDAVGTASIIDLISDPGAGPSVNAGGTIHHVAFRVKDEATLMEYRKKISDYGLQITPKIDRNYFFSLYFREPGGVLFEIATDNPGFDVDEPVNELGQHLKLPAQYESRRAEIEAALPVL